GAVSSRASCVRDKSRTAGDPVKRGATAGSAGSHGTLSDRGTASVLPASRRRHLSARAARCPPVVGGSMATGPGVHAISCRHTPSQPRLPRSTARAASVPLRRPGTVARVTDPQWSPLALAALAVLAGAVSVRTTGMGFALLSSPFLVMALGPVEGILVTNVCGIVAALLNLTVVRADLDWGRAAKVVPAGLGGTVPGALLVLWLAAPGLVFSIGSRSLPVPHSYWVGAGGGVASGVMPVTAGVGGLGLVIYALATQWEHRGLAATAQLHFAVLGAAALVAKWSLPTLPVSG